MVNSPAEVLVDVRYKRRLRHGLPSEEESSIIYFFALIVSSN